MLKTISPFRTGCSTTLAHRATTNNRSLVSSSCRAVSMVSSVDTERLAPVQLVKQLNERYEKVPK